MVGRRYAFALLVIMSAPAHADDAVAYVPPDFLSATPPLPSTIDASAAWRLDLREALQLAVKQNLGVTLERNTLHVSELSITVADGLFEPTLDASYIHGNFRTPPEMRTEGAAGEIVIDNTDRWIVSVSQRLSTGMRLSVDWISDRADTTSRDAVTPLNYRS